LFIFKRGLLGLERFDEVGHFGLVGLPEQRHGAGRLGVGAESSGHFTGDHFMRLTTQHLLALAATATGANTRQGRWGH
jgi:hypothetical protein